MAETDYLSRRGHESDRAYILLITNPCRDLTVSRIPSKEEPSIKLSLLDRGHPLCLRFLQIHKQVGTMLWTMVQAEKKLKKLLGMLDEIDKLVRFNLALGTHFNRFLHLNEASWTLLMRFQMSWNSCSKVGTSCTCYTCYALGFLKLRKCISAVD